MKADIGLIGLAVMGENLVLNMESKGFSVAVYNRTTSKVDDFIAGRGKGKKIFGAHSLSELVTLLKKPRKVMMMVKAGAAVDQTIEQLVPLLEPGDIIIDGGNSNYQDTIRRTHDLEAKGLLFVGSGVSGGEEGALNGPSLMPGGSEQAWLFIKPIFQAIAAKVEDGSPCCDWVGSDGAGHFVKMVHNGIEYGDMQLIAETFHIMRYRLGMSYDEMSAIFEDWNNGDLGSYLVEITRDILRYKDEDGSPLVEKILDTAGQKGTGKWAGIASLEFGVPLTLIAEAVYARLLSAAKDQRLVAAEILGESKGTAFSGDKKSFIDKLGKALYAAKIISYTQGFLLLKEAASNFGWKLNYGAIALMWRGGCIIRSTFLGKIKEAFDANPNLENLMFAPFFADKLKDSSDALRAVASECALAGIATPAFFSALAYYDGMRTRRLPANLLQAQRDYFGAHTYERVDRPRGEFFHTNWTGHGGTTAASTYNV